MTAGSRPRARTGSGGSSASTGSSSSSSSSSRGRAALDKLAGLAHLFSSSRDAAKSVPHSKVVKFQWTIPEFIQLGDVGADSKQVKVRINDVNTVWNISLRFWQTGRGEIVRDPVLFCCNLVSCGSESDSAGLAVAGVGLSYSLSHQTRCLADMQTAVALVPGAATQSVAAHTCSLPQHLLSPAGSLVLQVQLEFTWGGLGGQARAGLASWFAPFHHGPPDLFLVCGNHQFPVHKAQLAAASPVLAAIFAWDTNNNIKEKAEEVGAGGGCDRVAVTDLAPNTLHLLLQFIYTGQFGEVEKFGEAGQGATQDCWVELLMASSQYGLSALQGECEARLAAQLSPTGVSTTLLLADTTGSAALRQAALAYCRQYKEYIFKDPGWQRMEAERPELWASARQQVEPHTCARHEECVRQHNRYQDTEGGSSSSCDTRHYIAM